MELIVVIILALLFVSLIIYQVRSEQAWRMKNHEKTVINEKDHYYGLGFYCNRSDKRIIVPKRSGGGYTINFGNPVGIILIIITASAILYLLTQ